MSRERKIGIAVLASLLIVLGGMIAWRIHGATTESPLAQTDKASASAPGAGPQSSAPVRATAMPVLKSPPPTMLPVNSGPARSSQPAVGTASRAWQAAPSPSPPGGTEGRLSFMPRSPSGLPPDTDESAHRAAYDAQDAAVEERPQGKAAPGRAIAGAPKKSPGSSGSEPARLANRYPSLADEAQSSAMVADSGDEARLPAAPNNSAESPSGDNFRPRAVRTVGGTSRPGTSALADKTSQSGAPAANEPPAWQRGAAAAKPLAPAAESSAGQAPGQESGVYYVEPGDTFWQIARKVYGNGGYFKALQEHNRFRFPDPSKLTVGDEVLAPPAEVLIKKYSGLCPKERNVKPGTPALAGGPVRQAATGTSYVVEEGDTLYSIARHELGDSKRWPEIYHLNRASLGKDMDYLRPGTQIVLPAASPGAERDAEALARRPGPTLRR